MALESPEPAYRLFALGNDIYRLENATKNIRFNVKKPRCPKTDEELVELVHRAGSEQRKLKVIGGSHSFNHIFRTSGNLVDLRELNRAEHGAKYPLIDFDPVRHSADLHGGATLGEAIAALDRVGLHFSSLGSYYGQTIGGAIATSTHGSSLKHGSLSDSVLEVEALCADGKFHTFKNENDELRAMRAHLGQLGIVTRVKVQVEPAFWLACCIWTVSDCEGFDSVIELARQHEYVSMLWLPYTNEACIRVLVRVGVRHRNEASIKLKRRYSRTMAEKIMRNGCFWLVEHAYLCLPRLLAREYSNRFFKEFCDYDGVIDKSYKVFLYEQYRVPNDNAYLRMVLNVEYALDVERLRSGLKNLKETIEKYQSRGHYINYPRIHIRFALANDRTLVGLNAGRDTAYVGIYINESIRNGSQVAIAKEIESVLIDHDGRPHWGKYRYVDRDEPGFDRFERSYPDLVTFRRIRDELDPDGMFSNDSTSVMFADLDRSRKPLGGFIASLFDPRAYGRIPPPDDDDERLLVPASE
jgi:FAD/FMN-containing dehydrogenase